MASRMTRILDRDGVEVWRLTPEQVQGADGPWLYQLHVNGEVVVNIAGTAHLEALGWFLRAVQDDLTAGG